MRRAVGLTEPSGTAVTAIAGRLAGQVDALAEKFAEAYTDDIADYAAAPPSYRNGFVQSARANLDALLADLSGQAVDFDPAPFEAFGADRVQMGIPIGAVMRSFTVWGQQAWRAFRDSVDTADPAETSASLTIGERIFAHVERASAATAAGYMRQALTVWSDREITRNALLEAMLTGRAEVNEVQRKGFDVPDGYTVLVLAPRGSAPAEYLVGTAVDRIERLGFGPQVLVGVRDAYLVVVTPAVEVHDRARRLAEGLGVAAGISVSPCSLAGIPAAYADAHEAAWIARRLDLATPVGRDDVLLERLVLSSDLSSEIRDRGLGALASYDARRGSDLVATAEAFIESGGSVTEAARGVQVHPNTVVYRLHRIATLTGFDPRTARGLTLLSLAMTANRLSGEGATQ